MKPPPLPEIDLSRLKTCALDGRPSKVNVRDLGRVIAPGATVEELLEGLPHQLAAKSLLQWRDAICAARRENRAVVAALGGHVIKTGCGPYLIDWIKRGILTAVVLNGAAAIHDLELALAGHTSEDVEGRLPTGQFGMARETAQFFNRACALARKNQTGVGAALGTLLLQEPCSHPEASLLRAAAREEIPCTVHVAFGTDVVHMHPGVLGADLGEASARDFRLVCRVAAGLAGGVWMNLGSAVLLPEIFLKAVSVAHNLGFSLEGMTTVDLDMVHSYRARMNVLERHHCRSLAITGHHEIMIPLLHAAVAARLESPEGLSDKQSVLPSSLP